MRKGEWEDGGEAGGEIKLFFVLYLPQRLKESIHLSPRSAGDNNTHTHTHTFLNGPRLNLTALLSFVHMPLKALWRRGDESSPDIGDGDDEEEYRRGQANPAGLKQP